MAELFFTADQHFHHKNIIRYENRPFASVKEMNEQLIARWNKVVGKRDRTIILGDFVFASEQAARDILQQLNGRKGFIKGNHDDERILRKLGDCFEFVKDYCYLKTNYGHFVLSHYPFMSWEGKSHGSFHLYGHVHSKEPQNKQPGDLMYNVGVDVNNYTPVSVFEVLEKLGKRGRDID